jgi:hypothetical protein
MEDFAAAAMLRLIQHGLHMQGLDSALRPPRQRAAHIPLSQKRALLERLLQVHGPLVLLRIGEAANDLREEPVTLALSMAREPHDLIQRWQRLERFAHSRHRVRIDASTANAVSLRHVSHDPLRPPTPAEDLLVFGVLVGLLHGLGTLDLEARVSGEARARWCRGRWIDSALPADVSRWQLSWRTVPRAPNGLKAPRFRGFAGPCGAARLLNVALSTPRRRATPQNPAKRANSSVFQPDRCSRSRAASPRCVAGIHAARDPR